MCSASVDPIPSSISVPNRPVNRRITSAGRASPAVTVYRTDPRASRGSPASTMAAQNPGGAKSSVGRCRPSSSAARAGCRRIGIDDGTRAHATTGRTGVARARTRRTASATE